MTVKKCIPNYGGSNKFAYVIEEYPNYWGEEGLEIAYTTEAIPESEFLSLFK
jgi:hypothetical protein